MAKKTKVPAGWADLNEPELRAASEFFGTDNEAPLDVLLPDLVEAGVSWEMYSEKFLPEVTEVVVEDELKLQGSNNAVENVIKSTDINPPKEEKVVDKVVTADPNKVLAQADYLVKMERKNPYFEFAATSGKKYEFTQDNPYNIMPAQDAQEVLAGESGFRQAYPAELQEYYS